MARPEPTFRYCTPGIVPGRRCVTWPETGCTNREHEGMFTLCPLGPICVPCWRKLGGPK